MKLLIRYIPAALIMIVLSGCAMINTGATRAKKSPNEFHYTIPKFAQEIPSPAVTEKEPPKPQKSQQEFQLSQLTTTQTEKHQESGWGYRIQIFSSLRQEEAESVATVARQKLDEKIYVEFHPPYYKVRVGNCWTSEEASELLQKVKRAGFPDAWVVRATVVNEE